MKWLKVTFVISLINFFGLIAFLPSAKSMRQKIDDEVSRQILTTTPTPIVKIVKKFVTVTPSMINNQFQVSPAITKVPTLDPSPTVDNRCIVIVDGVSYDVTEFKNMHSGGDIFNCGTDMSAVFHDQHSDSYLRKMARYKI